MATGAPEVYTGKDSDVDIDGAVGSWSNYKLEITTKREECKPAKSRILRQCTIHKHAKLTLQGFRGGSECFADLAKVDVDVDSLTLTDPPPNFDDFTDWRIVDADMEQPDGPGKYTLVLEQGMSGSTTNAPSGGGGG